MADQLLAPDVEIEGGDGSVIPKKAGHTERGDYEPTDDYHDLIEDMFESDENCFDLSTGNMILKMFL